jgi:hypothetical protein
MVGCVQGLIASSGNLKFAELVTTTYSASANAPAEPQIFLRFNNSGEVATKEGADPFVTQYTWVLIGAASDYELFVHNAGPNSLASGPLDTWVEFAPPIPIYELTRATNGTSTAALEVQIRRKANLAVVATATITLQAIRNP